MARGAFLALVLWSFALWHGPAEAAAPADDRDPTATINVDLKPIIVNAPAFPYVNKSAVVKVVVKTRLKKKGEVENSITDVDDWFHRNVLPRPAPDLAEEARFVPSETRWGDLRFFRGNGANLFVGIYQAVKPRPDGVESGVYDQEFDYRAVVFDKDYKPIRLFILDELYPSMLEMATVVPVGNILYFDINYNGYANILKGRTGYLAAMDLATGDVLWSSAALTASYWHFLVHGDVVISGYGFTDEPDFLFVINRHDGTVLQKIKLRSAHEHLVVRGNILYVRTYDTDCTFDIVP